MPDFGTDVAANNALAAQNDSAFARISEGVNHAGYVAFGTGVGAAIGAAFGSLFGPGGTFFGGAAGGIVGEEIAQDAYEYWGIDARLHVYRSDMNVPIDFVRFVDNSSSSTKGVGTYTWKMDGFTIEHQAGLTLSTCKIKVTGTDGEDKINGCGRENEFYGGDDDDELWGGGGEDYLNGGKGRDRLKGGNGDDYINGSAGSDELWGGTGKNKFVFYDYGDGSEDIVYDFKQGDRAIADDGGEVDVDHLVITLGEQWGIKAAVLDDGTEVRFSGGIPMYNEPGISYDEMMDVARGWLA